MFIDTKSIFLSGQKLLTVPKYYIINIGKIGQGQFTLFPTQQAWDNLMNVDAIDDELLSPTGLCGKLLWCGLAGLDQLDDVMEIIGQAFRLQEEE